MTAPAHNLQVQAQVRALDEQGLRAAWDAGECTLAQLTRRAQVDGEAWVTPLGHAAAAGNLSLVKWLVSIGCPVDEHDSGPAFLTAADPLTLCLTEHGASLSARLEVFAFISERATWDERHWHVLMRAPPEFFAHRLAELVAEGATQIPAEAFDVMLEHASPASVQGLLRHFPLPRLTNRLYRGVHLSPLGMVVLRERTDLLEMVFDAAADPEFMGERAPGQPARLAECKFSPEMVQEVTRLLHARELDRQIARSSFPDRPRL